MEKDILSQVIEVEKEIQHCLEQEKAAAREWLESVKKECEEDYIREGKNSKDSLERSIVSVAGEAEKKAAEVVSRAVAATERLKGLDDAVLSRVVAKRIAKLLPE